MSASSASSPLSPPCPIGEVLNCRVIDVSLSDASIACRNKPPIDTEVILDRMRGRVVRHHPVRRASEDPYNIARTFG
ncbi:MAG: hypothetical protein ACREDO_09400 [Methyloceanibacter sp.]